MSEISLELKEALMPNGCEVDILGSDINMMKPTPKKEALVL